MDNDSLVKWVFLCTIMYIFLNNVYIEFVVAIGLARMGRCIFTKMCMLHTQLRTFFENYVLKIHWPVQTHPTAIAKTM